MSERTGWWVRRPFGGYTEKKQGRIFLPRESVGHDPADDKDSIARFDSNPPASESGRYKGKNEDPGCKNGTWGTLFSRAPAGGNEAHAQMRARAGAWCPWERGSGRAWGR
jgi:hypothetical protein